MAVPEAFHGLRSSAAYEERVIECVRSVLEERLARLIDSGQPLPSPDALAASMVAGIPDGRGAEAYGQLLGPFYSSAGVMRLLGIRTKQALDDRRRRGTILAARTADGVWAYPSFQFDVTARRVRPALAPVLVALKGAPRWGAALWLVTARDDLDGSSPEVAVDGEGARDRVVQLAQQYATAIAA